MRGDTVLDNFDRLEHMPELADHVTAFEQELAKGFWYALKLALLVAGVVLLSGGLGK